MKVIGIDIGGTKCAVSLAAVKDKELTFLEKESFSTPIGCPYDVLDRLFTIISKWLSAHNAQCIGISVGGPLDCDKGLVMSPPNLIGWDNIPVVEFFQIKTGLQTFLMNDANASALAEWKYGVGRGANNVVYLTFGTGLGAGLILDGRLYEGASGMAGEVGHIRMADSGPEGYGKAGSLEGFCSGGGIANMGRQYVLSALEKGKTAPLLQRAGCVENISAKLVAELADEGDCDCLKIYKQSGAVLGRGLAVLVDLFNPEKIIIGGVYMRSGHLMEKAMRQQLTKEGLQENVAACKILPSGLGEAVGDWAAVSVAIYKMEEQK